MAGSLVCARATVSYLKQQAPARVSFICTEAGIADQACADHMTALLRDEQPESSVMLDGIRAAGLEHGHALLARGDLTEAQWHRLKADLDCCLELDQFDFAMVVERRAGLLVMEAVGDGLRPI